LHEAGNSCFPLSRSCRTGLFPFLSALVLHVSEFNLFGSVRLLRDLLPRSINLFFIFNYYEQHSRYCDWLLAARPRSRSSSPGRAKNFHFSMSSRPTLASNQPPIQWVPGVLSPRVKRPALETDHSPPTSAEVKKMWTYEYASTPPYAFMAQCLIS
jgi:hypothetical protein